MKYPAERELRVGRHVDFSDDGPWRLRDKLTGVPIDLTGATITMEVRDYEGAPDLRLTATLAVINGPSGLFDTPDFDEADHEALPTSYLNPTTGTAEYRGRYDIKCVPATGRSFRIGKGPYVVEEGVSL